MPVSGAAKRYPLWEKPLPEILWHFKEHWDVWESLLQKPVYIKSFFHKPADVFFDTSGGECYYYIWELPVPTAETGKP